MAGIKGYPGQEKLDNTRQQFASVVPTGQKTHGLEVRAGITYTEAATDAAEAGSTTQVINATAHTAAVGDLISWTSGALSGQEYGVVATDTDEITVGVLMPSAPAPADTFAILRPKAPQVTSSGALTTGPIQFVRDGVDTEVEEDTGTPANNRPLPVKITGLDGDVSIDSANLNLEVQLDHDSANPDSVQIGDGTEIVQVTAAGQAEVILSTELPAGTNNIGDVDVTNFPATVDTDYAPAGANTIRTAAQIGSGTGEADFGAGAVSAQTLRAVIATDQTSIPVTDDGGSLTIDSTQLPADMGQEAMADSVPVAIASDQSAIPVTDNAGSLTVDDGGLTLSVDDGGSTLSIDSTQLPADMGQEAMADSVPVAIASDQSNVPTDQAGKSSVEVIRYDYTGGTVTTAAYTQLVASTSGAINRLHIFDSSGEIMILATGAAASEVDVFYIEPGGPGPVDLNIPSGTRLSVKALSANATLGDLVINGLS